MEYSFYLEQLYQPDGTVRARILTGAEAGKLGYEDGYVSKGAEGKLYVDGFNTEATIQNYLSDMVGVVMV